MAADLIQREQIALVKRARESDGSFELLLVYNLVRGFPLERGYNAPKGRAGSTHFRMHQALWHVEDKARSVGVELNVQQQTCLRDLLIQISLKDFELEVLTPGKAEARACLRRAMTATPHGERSTVMSHGWQSWSSYDVLRRTLRRNKTEEHWPDWLQEHGAYLLSRQVDVGAMNSYLVYHDCGKPFVMQRDEQGALHFPGHAQKSAQVWQLAGGSQQEVELMALDMVLHTAAVSDMREFASNPLAPSLLLSAYAELLSNAKSLFGGTDSVSFKIKLKALSRRAKALLAIWLENKGTAPPQNGELAHVERKS